MRTPRALPDITESLLSRFWKYVDKKAETDCWEWGGARSDRGYGKMGDGQFTFSTHRLSYLIHYGVDPRLMQVCHTCDNPPCVNPAHLFLGTQLDNILDKIEKGRAGGSVFLASPEPKPMDCYLVPYRRHLGSCAHGKKGQGYTMCACPIWADGKLDGKRYRRSLLTNDWVRAEQRIKALLGDGGGDDGDGGAPPPSRKYTTLGSAIHGFLQEARSRNLKASTIQGYEAAFKPMLALFGQDSPLASITLESLQRFRQGREIQASTNFREIVVVKTFFKWATENENLKVNPSLKLKLPRVDSPPTLPYTPQETQAMLAACDRITARANKDTAYFRKRARAFILLLMYSGLRVGDATFLRRDALDVESGYVTLRVMKTGVPLKVKLPTEAVNALVKLPALHPDYFFWDGRSRQLDSIMRYTISRIGALAGVDNAHPHRWRDTYACELLLNGVAIRTVQMLLGHKSVTTTERSYSHFVASHQALLDGATATLNFGGKSSGPVAVHPLKRRLRNA